MKKFSLVTAIVLGITVLFSGCGSNKVSCDNKDAISLLKNITYKNWTVSLIPNKGDLFPLNYIAGWEEDKMPIIDDLSLKECNKALKNYKAGNYNDWLESASKESKDLFYKRLNAIKVAKKEYDIKGNDKLSIGSIFLNGYDKVSNTTTCKATFIYKDSTGTYKKVIPYYIQKNKQGEMQVSVPGGIFRN